MKYYLLLTVMLTGCATGVPSEWGRSDGVDRNLQQDIYACKQENRIGQVAPSEDTRVFFYGTNKLAQGDANALYEKCMNLRGWAPAKK